MTFPFKVSVHLQFGGRVIPSMVQWECLNEVSLTAFEVHFLCDLGQVT